MGKSISTDGVASEKMDFEGLVFTFEGADLEVRFDTGERVNIGQKSLRVQAFTILKNLPCK